MTCYMKKTLPSFHGPFARLIFRLAAKLKTHLPYHPRDPRGTTHQDSGNKIGVGGVESGGLAKGQKSESSGRELPYIDFPHQRHINAPELVSIKSKPGEMSSLLVM